MATGRLVDGRALMIELAKALKIDRPIQAMTIDLDCHRAATVAIAFPVKESEVGELGQALEKYRIVLDEPGDHLELIDPTSNQ